MVKVHDWLRALWCRRKHRFVACKVAFCRDQSAVLSASKWCFPFDITKVQHSGSSLSCCCRIVALFPDTSVSSDVDAEVVADPFRDVWRHDLGVLFQSHTTQLLLVGLQPVHQRLHAYAGPVGQLLFTHCFHCGFRKKLREIRGNFNSLQAECGVAFVFKISIQG